MLTGESLPRFGDQDLVGGALLGEYRWGKLSGGERFFFEEIEGKKWLIVSGDRGRLLYSMWQDEMVLRLEAGEMLSAVYSREGEILAAAMEVQKCLLAAVRQGRLRLPKKVEEGIWRQRLSGETWLVTMLMVENESRVVTHRLEQSPQTGKSYRLIFNGALRYPFPGLDYGLLAVREGEHLGFEICGTDGGFVRLMFSSFIDPEALPAGRDLEKVRVADLIGAGFPGFEMWQG